MARKWAKLHLSETLLTKQRFVFINAVVVAILAISGGYFYYRATHADGSGLLQGYKVPNNQAAPSGATITIDRFFSTTANPYSVTASSGSPHQVQASTPSGWQLLGYTLCYNTTTCHNNTPTPGNTASVSVPAGGYADLYWHYAQVSTPTPTPPPPTPTPTPTHTPTPTPPPTHTPTPTPTPKPPTTPILTPKPGTGEGGSGGSSGSGSGSGSGQASATPDTLAPSAPTQLTANLGSDGSTVLLGWVAASDNVGVTGYIVERSTDQTTWTPLSANLSAQTYTDSSTAFSVHYYYRVRSVDAAGNQSPNATVDVTTGAFAANGGAGQSITVVSEDGIVTAQIPGDAIDGQANCSLLGNQDNVGSIKATKLLLAAAPYSLQCKTADGTELTSFATSVTLKVNLGAKSLQKFSNLKLYQYSSGSAAWQLFSGSSIDKKTATLTQVITEPVQIALLGTAKKGISKTLIAVVVLIILLGVGFVVWRLRQQKKQQYNEYIRHKYYDV